MMWNYDGGWSWLWMGSTMVLFWGGVLLLTIWAIRAIGHARYDRALAMDTLGQRLAAGEVSQEQFDKARKSLGSKA